MMIALINQNCLQEFTAQDYNDNTYNFLGKIQ